MTELIKQRLVGMLIVVIASVVFLPDLLDGQKNAVKEEFKKFPPRPDSTETPIARDFPMAEVKSAINKAPETNNDDLEDETLAQSNLQKSNSIQPAAEQVAAIKVTPANVEKPIEQELQQDTTEVEAPSQFASNAWVLRLGTFRNKPNVDALLSKLEEAGVTTFVKPVEVQAGTLYRVFVGPDLDKSKLEAAQKTLKELTGLDGKITKFEPIN